MNLTQLKAALPYVLRTDITLVLHGEYAEGKTGGLREFAKENNYGFHSLNIGTMGDIGDLIGVMRDDPTGAYSRFLPPEWLYKANKFCIDNPDKLFILLIDEANRTSLPGAFQAIMPIAAERRVHEHTMHENVKVMLAMNPPGPKYEVLNFNKDKARASRFAHVFLSSTAEEFLEYNKAQRNKGNLTLRFLSENTSAINVGGYVDVLSINEKNKRGWDYVAQLEDTGLEGVDENLFREIGNGLVGAAAFGERLKWKADYKTTSISAKEVLAAASKAALLPLVKTAESLAEREDGMSVAAAFVSDLATEIKEADITDKQVGNVQAVLMKLPREIIVSFYRTSFTGSDKQKANMAKVVMSGDFIKKYNTAHPIDKATVEKLAKIAQEVETKKEA